MFCFRDRSFCRSSHECAVSDCLFRMTDEERAAAIEEDMPVSYMELRDTDDCRGFVLRPAVELAREELPPDAKL